MRKAIIGLDLEKEYSQISYYSDRTGEPETVSIVQNEDKYLIPTPEGLFREKGKEKIQELAEFLKSCISFLKPMPDMEDIYMMITMREVRQPWIGWIRQACEDLGMIKENIFLQSYRESFFYYLMNQKKELWNHTSALFEYNQSQITAFLMKTDRRTKPALVQVVQGESIQLGSQIGRSAEEWNHRRDQKFLQLIQNTFQGEIVSSTFLIGDQFNKNWAVDSLQYLCRKRHVFQGRNLYTKGACYAMCRKLHIGRNLDAWLYESEDMIENNISMQMEIRGKKSEYMLISAGINWYEAQCRCEILMDEGDELVLYARSMRNAETNSFTIVLNGLPKRPPKTTRLQINLEYLSAVTCKVIVKDMGFGEFFQSSGLVWESVLNLE